MQDTNQKPHQLDVYWSKGFLVGPLGDEVGSASISIWETEEGEGTPLVVYEDDDIIGLAYTCSAIFPSLSTLQTPELGPVLKRLLEDPSKCDELTGVFALVIVDLRTNRVLVVGDRFGIQAVFQAEDAADQRWISTSITMLMQTMQHDGAVDEDMVLEQFGFGNVLSHGRSLYKGIHKLPPHSYTLCDKVCRIESYWREELSEDATLTERDRIAHMAERLRHLGSETSIPVSRIIGLTAGQDSLTLASTIHDDPTLTGLTYGADDWADVQQGTAIAEHLKWKHIRGGLSSADDYEEMARASAFYCGGMYPASAPDYIRFMKREVPRGMPYVFGEAGSCVRNYMYRKPHLTFREGIIKGYTTPAEDLRSVLGTRYQEAMSTYPGNIMDRIQPAQDSPICPPDAPIQTLFYRYYRLSGNSSMRYALLSSMRGLIIPFADREYVREAFRYAPHFHNDAQILRAIIEYSAPGLLPFFDKPAKSKPSSHNWLVRFAEGYGDEVHRMLKTHQADYADVFDPEAVLTVCAANQKEPSRSVFLLFRIAAFGLARSFFRHPDTQAGWLKEHSIRVGKRPIRARIAESP